MHKRFDTLINKRKTFSNINNMWNDHYRNQAYLDFINSVDLRGKTVLDAGCGIGMLSQMCLQHGANGVVSVDWNQDRVDFMQRWIEHPSNALGFKQKIICADILTDWEWPIHQQPDYIMHEFIGPYILNENLHKILTHLKQRFPDAKIVPDLARYSVHYFVYDPTSQDCTYSELIEQQRMACKPAVYDPGVTYSSTYINFINEELVKTATTNIFEINSKNTASMKHFATAADVQPYHIQSIETPTRITSSVPDQIQGKAGFALLTYEVAQTTNQWRCASEMGIVSGFASYMEAGATEVTFEYVDIKIPYWQCSWK